MRCTDCKYCVTQDTGYSNYTVEGCEADCLLGKNKYFPRDVWYGESPALQYANECNSFIVGAGPEFDVDGKITIECYKDDEEIYNLLIQWR